MALFVLPRLPSVGETKKGGQREEGKLESGLEKGRQTSPIHSKARKTVIKGKEGQTRGGEKKGKKRFHAGVFFLGNQGRGKKKKDGIQPKKKEKGGRGKTTSDLLPCNISFCHATKEKKRGKKGGKGVNQKDPRGDSNVHNSHVTALSGCERKNWWGAPGKRAENGERGKKKGKRGCYALIFFWKLYSATKKKGGKSWERGRKGKKEGATIFQTRPVSPFLENKGKKNKGIKPSGGGGEELIRMLYPKKNEKERKTAHKKRGGGGKKTHCFWGGKKKGGGMGGKKRKEVTNFSIPPHEIGGKKERPQQVLIGGKRRGEKVLVVVLHANEKRKNEFECKKGRKRISP